MILATLTRCKQREKRETELASTSDALFISNCFLSPRGKNKQRTFSGGFMKRSARFHLFPPSTVVAIFEKENFFRTARLHLIYRISGNYVSNEIEQKKKFHDSRAADAMPKNIFPPSTAAITLKLSRSASRSREYHASPSHFGLNKHKNCESIPWRALLFFSLDKEKSRRCNYNSKQMQVNLVRPMAWHASSSALKCEDRGESCAAQSESENSGK
jgi:hypothetical protein